MELLTGSVIKVKYNNSNIPGKSHMELLTGSVIKVKYNNSNIPGGHTWNYLQVL